MKFVFTNNFVNFAINCIDLVTLSGLTVNSDIIHSAKWITIGRNVEICSRNNREKFHVLLCPIISYYIILYLCICLLYYINYIILHYIILYNIM